MWPLEARGRELEDMVKAVSWKKEEREVEGGHGLNTFVGRREGLGSSENGLGFEPTGVKPDDYGALVYAGGGMYEYAAAKCCGENGRFEEQQELYCPHNKIWVLRSVKCGTTID
ncbi:hypothetical protein N7539_005726 [Penicillium diatomitis]|uniref:Uncharacterized protein n=1 Tax=Penicillium diatomitis TaxID=2819901 RepID=A0A9W9X5C9_9EURO|nr:uncharacterized protein N7539_005726 [Penicillium diatomitis]KAJ5483930.1 hypothetical protein N7539_005726 [Penicillium diatomitis]